jgi:hypothetical protein
VHLRGTRKGKRTTKLGVQKGNAQGGIRRDIVVVEGKGKEPFRLQSSSGATKDCRQALSVVLYTSLAPRLSAQIGSNLTQIALAKTPEPAVEFLKPYRTELH